ncbi:PilW family protein [Ralstonia solanacearum]|uniref:PilW family protein n=1 Tax=Ralstonia solanacearum TaxID=305 RepID=UPI00078C2A6C|nr:PilW family protein [Ralstonia solanacearum]AMP38342.1 pilus assembly protein PilW [Ralstonia solanacearum]AXV87169.1 pilus assembly protein PilW [Ralstonia solanacearum]AXW06659.1 pilus assembly protein PilW [Ralstonia solanacearum]AXW24401.1 pilus assembly protein PilW [Ralstonia solanacearum]AXW81338.1 pilus assembly protein PilW [Ralstonia solanacearum]
MRTIRRIRPRRTRGFSLVELMVALVIALLVLGATVSFYLLTRSTYTTIEDTSGLEERGQFALNVMTRVLRQAGFTKMTNDHSGGVMQLQPSDPPMVSGLDGCMSTEAAPKATGPAAGESLSNCLSPQTPTGSDAIEVRFFGVGTTADLATPDGTIIDCSGQGVADYTTSDLAASQRGLSMFFIQTGRDGNPYLACKFRKRDASGHEVTNTTNEDDFVTQQLVPGVETLQFLYGISTNKDTVPDVYKRASDMTADDWKQVFAIKVAMVVRADNASADTHVDAPTYTLFGNQYTTADGTFKPTQKLNVARRLFTTTVQVRNYLVCKEGTSQCQ